MVNLNMCMEPFFARFPAETLRSSTNVLLIDAAKATAFAMRLTPLPHDGSGSLEEFGAVRIESFRAVVMANLWSKE